MFLFFRYIYQTNPIFRIRHRTCDITGNVISFLIFFFLRHWLAWAKIVP